MLTATGMSLAVCTCRQTASMSGVEFDQESFWASRGPRLGAAGRVSADDAWDRQRRFKRAVIVSSYAKQFEHGVVQARIARRDDAAAIESRTAVPTRDLAAGAFDDRDQRGDVERFQARLDDHVDESHGHHGIAVAIAAKARQAHADERTRAKRSGFVARP